MGAKITTLDPRSMEESPLLQRISNTPKILAHLDGQKDWKAQREEISDEWDAFLRDVGERGVQVPVLYYREDGKVFAIDGRKRRAAAIATDRPVVPACEVSKEEAVRTAVASIALRGHVPKSAVAYMTVILHPQLTEAKHGGDRKTTGSGSSSALNTMTFRDAAALAGVSLGLIAEAVETAGALKHCPPKRRADLEAKLTAGLITLGDARKAAASGKAPPPGEKQSEETRRPEGYAAAIKAVKSLASRTRHWATWDEDAREAAREELTTAARDWAPEFREAMTEILQAAGMAAE